MSMSDPEHLENVRCSSCQGEFIELIPRRSERPADLPAEQHSEAHMPQQQRSHF